MTSANGTTATARIASKVQASAQAEKCAVNFASGLSSSARTAANATSAAGSTANSSIAAARAASARAMGQASAKAFQGTSIHGRTEMCDIARWYTEKPEKCPMGPPSLPGFTKPEMLASLPGFAQAFKAIHQVVPVQCCMGVNHMFAIYHSIKTLKPLAVIESGVAAGHGTFLIRQAAGPNIPIFSMDPGHPLMSYPGGGGIQGWADIYNPRTQYFTGAFFQDLAAARWDKLIPDPAVRERTLVILDDHQSSLERMKMLRRWGFKWVFYEDNYPFLLATSDDKYSCHDLGSVVTHAWSRNLHGDAYSPNTVCSDVPPGWSFVLHKDRFARKCQILTLEQHEDNVHWFQEHIAHYYEYPAVWSDCIDVKRQPLLVKEPQILSMYGFPQPDMELWNYGHLFPSLIELKPLAPDEKEQMLHVAIQAVNEFYQDSMVRGDPCVR